MVKLNKNNNLKPSLVIQYTLIKKTLVIWYTHNTLAIVCMWIKFFYIFSWPPPPTPCQKTLLKNGCREGAFTSAARPVQPTATTAAAKSFITFFDPLTRGMLHIQTHFYVLWPVPAGRTGPTLIAESQHRVQPWTNI